MIDIASTVKIDESELQFDFVRASGRGGQKVNKVAAAVQLRWNVAATATLDAEVKSRLVKLAGSRMTEDGVLIIEAKRYRTQEQNRLDAIARLVTLVQQSLVAPKPRRKTRPTRTSSAARVDEKKRRGSIKRTRRYKPEEWEN